MLAPLIEEGYVKLAFGGLEQGSFLTSSPIVSRVHLTGSAATYDAIVWQGKPKVGVTTFKDLACTRAVPRKRITVYLCLKRLVEACHCRKQP